jgi:hypothetical protein
VREAGACTYVPNDMHHCDNIFSHVTPSVFDLALQHFNELNVTRNYLWQISQLLKSRAQHSILWEEIWSEGLEQERMPQ